MSQNNKKKSINEMTEEFQNMSNEDLVVAYQDVKNERSALERDLAIKALIDNNMGLITSVVKRFTVHYKTKWEDLIDCGKGGLFLAAKRYDPKHDAAFSTFAYSEILAAVADEINSMVSDNSSNHYTSHIKLVKKAINGLRTIHGDEYIPDANMINVWIKSNTGKDIPVATIVSCLNGISQIDHLSTDDVNNKNLLASYDQEVAEMQEKRLSLRADIELGMKEMTKLEKFVFSARSGLYSDGKIFTYDQIAKMMNKKPDLIEMNNNKRFSAYYVETYYQKAVTKFKNNKVLSQIYDPNKSSNEYYVAMKNTQFIPVNTDLILDTAGDIADAIDSAFLPDGVFSLD